MQRIVPVPLLVVCLLAVLPGFSRGDEPAAEPVQPVLLIEELQRLREEKGALEERLKFLTCAPTFSSDELLRKGHQQLRELADNTRAQRQSMADFEGFVKWMGGSLTGYAKYIEAGSVLAGFARILPIPYAGQASALTKFVSQSVLALNATSTAIGAYLKSSQEFLAKAEAIDPAKGLAPPQLAEVARLANGDLSRDMAEVQVRLRSTAEVSASSLAFLEALNHYAGSTDEYWNRAKSLVTRKEIDKGDKSFLTTSVDGLRKRAGSFNAKLRTFEETSRKDAPLISNLAAYDGLVRELETKRTRGGS